MNFYPALLVVFLCGLSAGMVIGGWLREELK
jgi:hypothetical protein